MSLFPVLGIRLPCCLAGFPVAQRLPLWPG